MIIDYLDDNNGELLVKFAEHIQIPQYVKKASLQELYPDRNKLPITVFADPVHKKFPCHTPAATWLSALYFMDKEAQLKNKDDIRKNIASFAQFFGITNDIKNLWQQQKVAHNKNDQDDRNFGIVYVENGIKHRKLPLFNAAQVKQAAEWLCQYRNELPYKMRQMIATKILDKAHEYGAHLEKYGETIERISGYGIGSMHEIKNAIMNRLRLSSSQMIKEGISRILHTLEVNPLLQKDNTVMMKLAEVIDNFDRMYGLHKKYDGHVLLPPEDIIFKVSLTKAAEVVADHVTTTTGNVYSKNDLRRVSVSALREAFGDDFIELIVDQFGKVDVDKLAEQIATLPRPDAELLEKILKNQGITPYAHKEGSARIKQTFQIPQVMWLMLSRHYKPNPFRRPL